MQQGPALEPAPQSPPPLPPPEALQSLPPWFRRPSGPGEGAPRGQSAMQALADIGLRFVQEQMRTAASGTPMDPA
eukprot:1035658-Alexandrium_andersonii.AAC.1